MHETCNDLALSMLRERVRSARDEVALRRQDPGRRDDLGRAHLELRRSLEALVHELEQRRLPVPYALHAELRLHQDIDPR
ncbi:hypothetical protein JOE61_000945 [Nocardioides salarius]|uniref:Uncharacterized protein n=1 Tax=Nocardioides salarius TaxID=374513 RepID=A0ABS2M7G2_9ACTN|nr:hypothetical protein [Nocardioides salarius]MBM7507131.1 hypothetical protein [Nocardioides salarius]